MRSGANDTLLPAALPFGLSGIGGTRGEGHADCLFGIGQTAPRRSLKTRQNEPSVHDGAGVVFHAVERRRVRRSSAAAMATT